MVVEDEKEDLVGYCIADGNSAEYLNKYSPYLTKLREKYPKVRNKELLIKVIYGDFPPMDFENFLDLFVNPEGDWRRCSDRSRATGIA